MVDGITIRTPSRLHFGLFGWGKLARRQFGGVGLMIDDPGLIVRIRPSPEWSAAGPLAERALAIGQSVALRLPSSKKLGPFAIEIQQAPPLHVGLGVGTQLSLAIARGLTALTTPGPTDVAALARLTDRGRRSGIGVHGFAEGGFLIDAGTRNEGGVPTRLARLAFPEHWSILIVIPPHEPGLHGSDEVDAFDRIGDVPERLTDRLCALVLLGLYPALLETDLPAFGLALDDLQATVGEIFSPAQGGRFSHQPAERLLHLMKRAGLHGVGQSSWGPTLYGFTDAPPTARASIAQTLLQHAAPPGTTLLWTRPSPSGAVITPPP